MLEDLELINAVDKATLYSILDLLRKNKKV